MSYAEQWKEAEKNQQVVDVSPTWVAWEKKGQSILGRLKGSSDVSSTLSEGTYKQYLMDTDKGLIKFSMGGAADRELSTVLVMGNVYKVTFLGKIKISGGRQVNQFNVMAAQPSDDLSITDSDVPF